MTERIHILIHWSEVRITLDQSYNVFRAVTAQKRKPCGYLWIITFIVMIFIENVKTYKDIFLNKFQPYSGIDLLSGMVDEVFVEGTEFLREILLQMIENLGISIIIICHLVITKKSIFVLCKQSGFNSISKS